MENKLNKNEMLVYLKKSLQIYKENKKFDLEIDNGYDKGAINFINILISKIDDFNTNDDVYKFNYKEFNKFKLKYNQIKNFDENSRNNRNFIRGNITVIKNLNN